MSSSHIYHLRKTCDRAFLKVVLFVVAISFPWLLAGCTLKFVRDGEQQHTKSEIKIRDSVYTVPVPHITIRDSARKTTLLRLAQPVRVDESTSVLPFWGEKTTSPVADTVFLVDSINISFDSASGDQVFDTLYHLEFHPTNNTVTGFVRPNTVPLRVRDTTTVTNRVIESISFEEKLTYGLMGIGLAVMLVAGAIVIKNLPF